MELEHETQRKILLKLIHHPELGFNELWAKEGESNKFAYHVNKLEELDLICKTANGAYSLTAQGRRMSAFIEGDTGGKAEFPILTVVLFVHKGDKVLCQKRLKEPYYGLWGFVSGKINFGFNLFECASRDLLEETGLIAKEWKFKAIEMVKTIEQGKIIFHHYLLWCETYEPEGALKEKTHKAENVWFTIEEYAKT
ncbi:MAG: NUDIX domain-containing protein [Candidatus Woesearchaeota archaeon]|nr:NUDIX domain-containing protein [Candidatus Woesearchaeota archaeon]